MRIVLSVFALLCLTFSGMLAQVLPDSLTSLSSEMNESSGLVWVDGRLLTHNDSGGEPILYEVDTLTGQVLRRVVVENATNVDWEDIARDSSYLYVGDMGNNLGSRQDLRIYRIGIGDYLAMDTVIADTISFAYADQTDFTPSQFSTNFDAEALVAFGDSLYLFTKNWGNAKTYVYPIPKLPGDYLVAKTDSLNPQGLITGASFNPDRAELMLTGYTFFNAFILRLGQLSSLPFSAHLSEQSPLQLNGSFQVESIASTDGSRYYFSAEESNGGEAALYGITFASTLAIEDVSNIPLHIFPNPSSSLLQVDAQEAVRLVLFSPDGKRIRHSSQPDLSVADLPPGMYILRVELAVSQEVFFRKVWVRR